MADLYDILGVDKDASQEQIRKAYKSQAGKCHPDKNQSDPEAKVKFQALVKAYDVLKNADKRKRYDETGSEDDAPSVDESAKGIIAKIWLEMAERAQFQPRNYLHEVTKALQNSLRGCMVEKKRLENDFDKLEYLISETEADDVFLNMLNSKLHEIKHQKAHAEEASVVMHRALELLDQYKYTGEIPRPNTSAGMPWQVDPYIS